MDGGTARAVRAVFFVPRHVCRRQPGVALRVAVATAFFLANAAPVYAQSLPQGGTVTAGSASIGAPSGNTLTINQSSQQAIINWNSFSVGAGNTVFFNQPGASSATLNRVTGNTPSSIAGTIRAPGTVLLVNPNGIAITSTGIVNTGSFAASSLDIKDSDFLAGRHKFTGNGSSAPVTNAGRINTADGGFAALLGGRVANDGYISAKLGKVGLGSGELITLDLSGDGFMQVAVPSNRLGSLYDDQGKPLVSNAGKIRANGGLVQLKASTAAGLLVDAVNVPGSIRARSVGTQGGRIYLGGGPGGKVTVSGTVAANSKRGKAGSVTVEGASVDIGGKVAAKGKSGGAIAVSSDDLINLTGALDARGTAGQGGTVGLSGVQTVNTGAIDVSGTSGGAVDIKTYDYLNAGSVKLVGSDGAGGTFTVTATGNYVETTAGSVNASGTTAGGSIAISANRIFSSGMQDVTASIGTGGKITLEADSIMLIAATLDASGGAGGGKVLIGGDFQGGGTMRHALNVDASPDTVIRADARNGGNGGTIVLWSDDTTNFYGKSSAKGGVTFGDGGLIEVSGKLHDVFGGDADLAAPNGTAGTLLLDPKNIIIGDASTIYPYYQLVDPNAAAGNAFGNDVLTLANGNVIVTAPTTTVAGKAKAGAVYYFNGVTGALISQLSGASANEQAGVNNSRTALMALTGNNNFLVSTSAWSNGGTAANAGALTWGSGTSGVSGVISSANSLVGSSANDRVGISVLTLSNGNYVVTSANWNNGAATAAGAVTFGNGTTGVTGVVSAANSLVGTGKNDSVGSGVTTPPVEIGSGNYVFLSPFWGNNGTIANGLGAITWGSGTAGHAVGTLSSSNSFVGSNAGDRVGSAGTVVLTNGNYVVSSPNWNSNRGAVTWGTSGTAITGTLSSSNSLVGGTANDYLGSNYSLLGVTQTTQGLAQRDIIALTNGNYVVGSPYFNNGSTADAGATTWGNGATGTSGVVSSSNSVVGTHANDHVGVLLSAIAGGKYVAANFDYSGAAAKTGAVSLYDGTSAATGNYSTTGALTGSQANDQVGYGGIIELSNGNYVVSSPLWKNGGAAAAGAVTWVNGADGKLTGGAASGAVSATNSLVGSKANDWIGTSVSKYTDTAIVANNPYILALNNGNYVVASPMWDNGNTSNAGAVTWGNGATGATVGVISAANSLVGSSADDRVGMVASYSVNTQTNAISFPFVGFGLTALSNNNYIVTSSHWTNAGVKYAGAVTWGNGAGGTVGAISTANSLYGTKVGDVVGFGTTITNGTNYAFEPLNFGTLYGVVPLSNGSYIVRSSMWGNGANTNAGAVTFLTGTTAGAGAVSATNSLVGTQKSDFVGVDGVLINTDGSILVSSSSWNNGALATAGAVTFGSIATGLPVGVITAQNSIIGTQAGAYVGNAVANRVKMLPDGVFAIGVWGSGLGGQVFMAIANPNALTYARAQTQDITISAARLSALLKAGTNITLQANNDITINSDIFAINLFSDPGSGSLTLDAGRSILVNANLIIDGAITLRANRPLSAGVVDSQRDPGVAVVTMAAGAEISSARGAISIRLEDGAGKTNKDAGAITLAFVGTDTGGGRVEIINSGLGGAADVIIGPGGGVTTYTVNLGGLNGDPTTAAIVIASLNGDFINNSGFNNVVKAFNNNRFVIYTGKTTDTVLGTLPAYTVAGGITYPTTAGVPSGNAVVYRVANKVLTIVVDSKTKTYGDANPALTYTIDSAGLQNGDTLGAAVSGTASVTTTATASSSVGSYTLTGAVGTLTSSLGYSFKFVDGTLTVTAKTLTASYASTISKTYDGLTTATLASNAFSLSGIVGGDAVSIVSTTGNYNNQNVGTGKTVSVSGLTLTGAAAGNYVLASSSLSSAAGTITAKALTASLVSSVSKEYDGTDAATLASGNYALSGVVVGETVTVSATAATYNNKNAASGKTVTATGLTLGGAGASNYSLAQTTVSAANGTISQKTVGVSLIAADKVYDGTTTVTNSNIISLTPSTIIAGDTVGVSGVGTYADKNVGTSKSYTIVSTLNGADAANYTLGSSASLVRTNGTITAKTVTAALTGTVSKVYNADTVASLSGANYTLSGVIANETVSLNNPSSGTYDTKNAGTGKTVSVTGLSISGGGAGNYVLASTSVSGAVGTITAKSLTVTLANTAIAKTYDGTADATVAAANFSLTGLVGGDAITVANTTGSYNDANAGTSKTVTVTGITLTGTGAANYALQSPTASAAVGTINKATVTASLTGIVSKVFDGTTSATLSSSNYSLAGVIGSDVVGLNNPASGSYDSASASVGGAVDKTVTVIGLALNGAGAGNYQLASTTVQGLVGRIDPLVVSLSILLTGSTSKVYDGNTDATLVGGNFAISGLVSGQTAVALLNTPTTGTYDTKNAGTGKTVTATVTGVSLTGADAGNYQLSSAATATGAIGTITPLTITATFNGAISKTYDGTTAASLTNSNVTLTGALLGETVALANASGTYDTKDAGSGKTVSFGGLALSGATAVNYVLSSNSLSGANGTVTQKPLTVSLTGSVSKTYDQSTDATLAAGNYTVSGVVGGDAVTLNNPASGTYDTKNAGTAKTVSVTGLSISGLDANNYSLSSTTAQGAVGTVLAKTISASLTGTVSKTYDGTDAATLTSGNYSLAGVINGDTVTVSGTGTFDTKHAGSIKTVTASGLTLAGADASNYLLAATSDAQSIGTITARDITVALTGVTSRTYDGTTDAALAGTNFVVNDTVFQADVTAGSLGLTTPSNGALNSKNVGTGKTVTATGFAITGADKDNYNLTSSSAAAAIGTVSAKTLTAALNGTFSKTYDGNETAGVLAADFGVTGRVGTEDVSITGFSAVYDSKNVGTGKTVTANALTLGGADAGNYVLAAATVTNTNGTIAAKTLTAALTGPITKVYDGNADAAGLNAGNYALTGAVTGEIVGITTPALGAYNDKNAGSNKTVTVTGITLTGADAGNYTLASSTLTNTAAEITPKTVTVTLSAAFTKVYDGTADVSFNSSSLTLNGKVVGDTLVLGAPTNVSYDNKNAGTGKTVSVVGLSLSGTDSGNYVLKSSSLTTNTAEITRLSVSAALGGEVLKTYDGTDTAAVGTGNYVVNNTIFNRDIANGTLNITNGGATYDTVNVGASKQVSVSGIVLVGADAANYTLVSPASQQAAIGRIVPAPITVAADNLSKPFNGVDPALTFTITSGQLYAADAFTGAVDRTKGEAAGSYAINQGTLLLTPNYDLTFVPGTFVIDNGSTPTSQPSTSVVAGATSPASGFFSSKVTQFWGIDFMTGTTSNNSAVDSIFGFDNKMPF